MLSTQCDSCCLLHDVLDPPPPQVTCRYRQRYAVTAAAMAAPMPNCTRHVTSAWLALTWLPVAPCRRAGGVVEGLVRCADDDDDDIAGPVSS